MVFFRTAPALRPPPPPPPPLRLVLPMLLLVLLLPEVLGAWEVPGDLRLLLGKAGRFLWPGRRLGAPPPPRMEVVVCGVRCSKSKS